MGIELAKNLFARHAANLTAGELVVLGYMCVVALDRENAKGQPARMYFGGRGALAIALGYDETSEAGIQKVKRAIQSLRKRGLIEPMVEHARTGTRQSYRLNIGLPRGSEVDPLKGSEVDPQEGVNSVPFRGSEVDPPRTNTGRGQDLPQDISIASVTELQKARANRETA